MFFKRERRAFFIDYSNEKQMRWFEEAKKKINFIDTGLAINETETGKEIGRFVTVKGSRKFEELVGIKIASFVDEVATGRVTLNENGVASLSFEEES